MVRLLMPVLLHMDKVQHQVTELHLQALLQMPIFF
jgi:hypothetical protein